MWFKKAFFNLADWLMIDRELKRPLNELRATLGLPPIAHVMHQWMHSPQLVIGFFPEWFAARQPDWPGNMHLVGFPLWDTGAARALPREADDFLGTGDAPVVFTPGSAAATMHRGWSWLPFVPTYRVDVHDEGAGTWSAAGERGYLRETGNLLFHLALVGLLVSVATGHAGPDADIIERGEHRLILMAQN